MPPLKYLLNLQCNNDKADQDNDTNNDNDNDKIDHVAMH